MLQVMLLAMWIICFFQELITILEREVFFSGVNLWNFLPRVVTEATHLSLFKKLYSDLIM